MVVRSQIEQQLHTRIATGDVAGAAEQLVLLYGSEVLGRCRSLVRDPAVAEDLAQDAFCRAFDGLPGFRGEASFRTWLFTIVRNVCIDHHRRTAGVAWLRDEGAEAEEQPEERPILLELMIDREQLERALAALDERERALVVLRFVHGMEYAELAACFGLREATIRMRLCRALTRMRDALALRGPARGGRGTGDADAVREPVRPRARFPELGRSGRAEGDRPLPSSRLEAPPSAAVDAPEAAARGASSGIGSDELETLRRVARVRLSVGDAAFLIEADDERAARDALPPLSRALGLLLERGESRPSAEALLGELRPRIDGLVEAGGGHAAPAPRRRWLDRLFGRSPRV